jgi:hypothetical protein
MPPVSRRQKQYQDKLRGVQNRNLFAGLLLLFAIAAAIYFIFYVSPDPKPKLFVSVNRIDHSGPREIPFSENSCAVLQDAFSANVQSVTDSIQELDEQESKLQLFDQQIGRDDILVVYLNGHIKNNGDEICWIGPESDNLALMELQKLLTQVNESKAKTKIVLLDAGRYSWSPVFPGRDPNRFQTLLAEALKENAWNLGDDFWIITSHSDSEISQVSTPLESSIFAQAVRHSIEKIADKNLDTLNVEDFFDEVYKHTISFSRNFKNESIQHPVLIKTDVGIVDPQQPVSGEKTLVLTVKSKPPVDPNAKPEIEPKHSWNLYARRPDRFVDWFYQDKHFAALPGATIRKLERFLELGEDSPGFLSMEQEKIDVYEKQIQQSVTRPSKPSKFNISTINDKHSILGRYRQGLLEFSVLLRMRNQMRFWDDDTYKDLTEIPLPPRLSKVVPLSDDQLQRSTQIPPDIDVWLQRWNDFKIRNEELIETVNIQLGTDKTLTPVQAELLGQLSRRYVPLIKTVQPEADPDAERSNKKDSPVVGEFTLNLESVERTERFNPDRQPTDQNPGAGLEFVVNESVKEAQRLRVAYAETKSDNAYRYFLAASGSDQQDIEIGLAPSIAWEELEPSISIAGDNPSNVYQIYPIDLVHVRFQLELTAVESVELSLEPTGEQMDKLKFGFDDDFNVTKIPVAEYDPTDRNRKKTEFDLFFQFPELIDSDIGRRFSFKLTAIDRNGNAKPTTLDLRIEPNEDATFWLTSERAVASQDDDVRTRLYRWGDQPDESDWDPIVIQSLANVKSPFDFRLTNNANGPRNFNVKLFRIERFPREINKRLLRSDRADWKGASEYANWLKAQNSLEGASILQRKDYLKLIATANLNLDVKQTRPISFTLPPPEDPDAKPIPSVTEEIKLGALMVFFRDDAPTEPAWYQLVTFEPKRSANAAKEPLLKPMPDVDDVFRDDIGKLAPLLQTQEGEEEVVAASLTIVSQDARNQNRHIVKRLGLEELLDGAQFNPGDEPALLMLDVLGVSNYGIYESNRAAPNTTQLRNQLTGIRVSSLPKEWKSYPETWSFTARSEQGPPFEWLSGLAGQEQRIFIRPSDEVDGPTTVGKIGLELYLPIENDLLSRSKDDFWVRWKSGDKSLLYPTERRHFLEISNAGLSAWTRAQSHQISVSDVDDEVLEIGKLSDKNTPLGRWRFVMKSLRNRPKISANVNKLYNRRSDFKTTVVKIDIRDITPPVTTESMGLTIDGKAIKKLPRFLEDREKSKGVFEFTLYELYQASGLQGLSPDTDLEVEVKDFFGEVTSNTWPLTISEVPKPKKTKAEIASEIKPVNMYLVFMSADDKPIKVDDIKEVKINGTILPWTKPTIVNKRSVTAYRKMRTQNRIEIRGLAPNETYSVEVTGVYRRENQAQFTTGSTTKTGIKLTEDTEVKIEFK